MGLIEPFKKWKRTLDIHTTSSFEKGCRFWFRLSTAFKRVLLFIVFFLILFFYLSPNFYTIFRESSQTTEGILQKCLEDHVFQVYYDLGFSRRFRFIGSDDSTSEYFPFVGNGAFGVSFHPIPTLYLKDGRTLSLNTNWNPTMSLNSGAPMKETFFTDFLTGTVHRYQCFANGLFVSSSYFAHRTNPYLFYQDVYVSNPTDHDVNIEFSKVNSPDWLWSKSELPRSFGNDAGNVQSLSFSGIVKNYTNQESLALCLNLKGWTQAFKMPAHRTKHFTFSLVIYQEKIPPSHFSANKLQVERKCKEIMKKASSTGSLDWQQSHISSWKKLWSSGLTISLSKASGALNDDRINATLYYVLSNVLMNNSQNSQNSLIKSNVTSYVSMAEGCYGGYHHTLQALSLWKSMTAFKEVNESVSLWLLTLEKQGCHKLLLAGAEGVMQAMILSFGGFRFSAHHLEFKIDPKFLHRDYFFRNIQIDYGAYINVSVILKEDNKAMLAVSINRNDKAYFACDGGCIDEPVQLRSSETSFPVKMTEPITSILYITSDKDHIELIKDTLHVHKIVEAPAHDHHVVALHRHGSHLGGLPLMFWATVCILIVIFHLFLCKLIFNEYCGKQEKFKTRYARV